MTTQPEQRIYLPPQWHEDIELLAHVGCYSNTLLLVSGISGAGKTTLLQAFCEHIEKDCQLTTFTQHTELAVQTFCRTLANRFRVNERVLSQISLPQQAKLLLQNLAYTQQNYLVCIDDAHELPDDVLEMILFFIQVQQKRSVCLHFILFAKPEFTSRLMRFSMAQQLDQQVHHIELAPQTYAEIEHYLRYYFVNQYNLSRLNYTKQQLQKLYKQSQGYIGLFQTLAKHFFVDRKSNKEVAKKNRWVLRGLSLSMISVCLVLLAYSANSVLQRGNNERPMQMISRVYAPHVVKTDLSQTSIARLHPVKPIHIEPLEHMTMAWQSHAHQANSALVVSHVSRRLSEIEYMHAFLTPHKEMVTRHYVLKNILLKSIIS